MKHALFEEGDGHTALPEEDRHGLIPTYIATRGDLFEAEQRNIANALVRRHPSVATMLDDKYLRDLHHDMFGDVWKWAGHYRVRETNIGIDPARIAISVRNLVGDAQAWIEFHAFDIDELACRFHRRLVQIHPFPNGNGRHGRIATDLLLRAIGVAPFTWGRRTYSDTEELRHTYLTALRRADRGEVTELVAFARS